MGSDLDKVPAAVVIAKRNREAFERIGVTEEKVFTTIRKAMGALKTPREIKMGEHRAVKREADWPTRLKAIELYMELTSVTPATAMKTMQGVSIEMTPEPEEDTAIQSYARQRAIIEQAKLAAGMTSSSLQDTEELPDEVIMPKKTALTLKEVMARREREQSEREEVEATPKAQRFKPTTGLTLKDI